MIKNILHIGLIGAFVFVLQALSFAQQLPQFNQYFFNPLGINPAYAGSRDAISAQMLARSQWVGFEGAPESQTVSIHAPIKKLNMGVGFQAINDIIGPRTFTGLYGNYAYKIKLGRGKLAFGLRTGIVFYKFDFNKLNYFDKDDPLYQGNTNFVLPSFDFGIYYNDRKFYVGAEITNLNQAKIQVIDTVNYSGNLSSLYNQINVTAGYAWRINKHLTYKPSVLLKTAGSSPFIFDVNNSILLNEKIWFGLTYRYGYGMIFITELNLLKGLRIGYSYDYTFNRLRLANLGSQEIFIGLDFGKTASKMISPRYF